MGIGGNGKDWRKFALLYIIAVVALGISVGCVVQIATGSEDEGGKSAIDSEYLRDIALKALEVALWSGAIGVIGTAALPYLPGIGCLFTKKDGGTT